MEYQIPLFQLNFNEDEIQAVADTIRSKWISQVLNVKNWRICLLK